MSVFSSPVGSSESPAGFAAADDGPRSAPPAGASEGGQDRDAGVIHRNFVKFCLVRNTAGRLTRQGQFDAAVVHAEMAAILAVRQHPGLFVSHELEQILLDIGRRSMPRASGPGMSTPPVMPRTVLHVFTAVASVGGHTRMLIRWIEHDWERAHSVVLTRQIGQDIPNRLREAVATSGGTIKRLNNTTGSHLAWARRLRAIAAGADLIVLHVHNYDALPLIAFADRTQPAPIVLLDHADHLFWLGAAVTDLAVHLRQSGMRLAQERRGIAPERSMLLPTPIDLPQRLKSRIEAKRCLGLPGDGIVLLSVARSLKYRTVDGMTFADRHVPLLLRHPHVILLVIGAGRREDWAHAVASTDGRIITSDEQEQTRLYFEAADIYVDSFPFVSTTSLLEAGSFGLPVVSRSAHADRSAILSADVPGLIGFTITTASDEDYHTALSRLIMDQAYRVGLGEATKANIAGQHSGDAWLARLEAIYRTAMMLPRAFALPPSADEPSAGEPDILLPPVFGTEVSLNGLARSQIKTLPLWARACLWHDLVSKGEFRDIGVFRSLKSLVPEWLVAMAKSQAPAWMMRWL